MEKRLSEFSRWMSDAWADDTFKRNLFISSCSVLIVMLCILLVGSCRDHVVYIHEPYIEIPESDHDILEDDLLVSNRKSIFEEAKIGTRPFDRIDDILDFNDPLDFIKDPVKDSLREAKRRENLKFFGLSSTEEDSLKSRKGDLLPAETIFLQRNYEPTPDFLDKVYETMEDRPVLVVVLAAAALGAALVVWFVMTLLLVPFQWILRKSKCK